jgi:DhnA family fructose-bisphosphate aldolase class Ia
MITTPGKAIRMKRLLRTDSNSSIIFAIDHGMTSPTYLGELDRTKEITRDAIAGGAHVVMLSQGFWPKVAEVFERDTSLALMLTASAPRSPRNPIQTPISSVDQALRLGADAVVVFVALQLKSDPEMISYLSKIGEECELKGMPLIAEAEYPTTYQSLDNLTDSYGKDYLFYNARLCAELGADIIKVNWTGDKKSFGEIVKATQVPVVLAGGSRIADRELLERYEAAISVGAVGCSVGRNIFQHQNPKAITIALRRVIEEKWPAKEAYEELQGQLASKGTISTAA